MSAVAALAVGVAACDTGDGTTLREPTTETTLPPPDTTPLPSEPLADEPPADDPAADDPAADDPIVDAGAEALPGSEVLDAVDELTGPAALQLFAPWVDGASIDPRYGCDGSNVSPPVSWSALPDGTVELAVAFEDLDNTANGRPFLHWVLAGIDASRFTGIAEGEVPLGAVQGLNFFGDVGWTGPCPNPGETDTYRLTVFALNQQTELADATPAAELLDFVNSVSIGSASVTGTSTR